MEHTGYGSDRRCACLVFFARRPWDTELEKRLGQPTASPPSEQLPAGLRGYGCPREKKTRPGESRLASPSNGLSILPPASTPNTGVSTLDTSAEYTAPISKFIELSGESTGCTLTSHNATSHLIDRPISRNVSSNQGPMDSRALKEFPPKRCSERESSTEEPSLACPLRPADDVDGQAFPSPIPRSPPPPAQSLQYRRMGFSACPKAFLVTSWLRESGCTVSSSYWHREDHPTGVLNTFIARSIVRGQIQNLERKQLATIKAGGDQ